MNTLISRMLVAILVAFAGVAWADQNSTADEFTSRLQNLQAATQAQLTALSEQISATTDPVTQETLNRQVEEIKHNAEIDRLGILLDWANADGDLERAAEISQALDHWLNPPAPQTYPEVESDKKLAPGQQTDATKQ